VVLGSPQYYVIQRSHIGGTRNEADHEPRGCRV
jgi:hypothetical protein